MNPLTKWERSAISVTGNGHFFPTRLLIKELDCCNFDDCCIIFFHNALLSCVNCAKFSLTTYLSQYFVITCIIKRSYSTWSFISANGRQLTWNRNIRISGAEVTGKRVSRKSIIDLFNLLSYSANSLFRPLEISLYNSESEVSPPNSPLKKNRSVLTVS